MLESEFCRSKESDDPESSIICIVFSPILPEIVTASVLDVATIIVGSSVGLIVEGDDCCPAQPSLGRFPEDNFVVVEGSHAACAPASHN